ncbi:MBL fold metallo-hydrolase [Kitasatospora acidiphila]|uniref:MBL fold metallo-hydrolase n=1 Tax=Kitasatospora acidiphila TaxID=2567942 RepID=UPI0015F0BBAD|nr:MBL fold metallo-hydrolase [Kitasatospora acidiphila]
MTIHHLDCATMCPLGGRLLLGSGGPLFGRLVSHCLLVESEAGLILVDTGFGTGDVTDPGRLGRQFRFNSRPQLSLARTALHQIRILGHDPRDVRHIVLTHLDPDHAGGLADFPQAQVHLLADELRAARELATRAERQRYRTAQWEHNPRWVEHQATGTESWFDFQAIPLLPDELPELLLVPLVGHTRGHTGVALRDDDGWLLHCGDAYLSRADVAPDSAGGPPVLSMFQRAIATDDRTRRHNLERLRDLARSHADEVRLVCSHDPYELVEALGRVAPR